LAGQHKSTSTVINPRPGLTMESRISTRSAGIHEAVNQIEQFASQNCFAGIKGDEIGKPLGFTVFSIS
jgi:hypothetical protein